MQAPNFSLPDQNGQIHTLQGYAGKWLVLYFYPEDETSGCTTEACSFRDGRELLSELGLTVVGVSKDSIESHKAFADHHELNFTLLSDPTHEAIEAYHSWDTTQAKRNTVLINPEGQIVKRYEGVDPSKHVGQIIEDFKALKNAA